MLADLQVAQVEISKNAVSEGQLAEGVILEFGELRTKDNTGKIILDDRLEVRCIKLLARYSET